MDLGLTYNDDFFSSAGLLSPEEMDALLNPAHGPVLEEPSAIQVLLNQGAEYLAAQQHHPLADLKSSLQAYLSQKSPKILSLAETPNRADLTKPLVCPFQVGEETGFIAFDWTTCYILIDALLGGINGVSIEKKQEQPYSVLEKNMLMPLCYKTVSLIGNFLKIPVNAHPLIMTVPPQTPNESRFIILVRTAGATGKICIGLPSTSVPSPCEDLLFENQWDKLLSIPFTSTAILKTYQTLKRVSAWTVGTVIEIPSSIKRPIQITCHNTPLYNARLKTQGIIRQVEIEGEK